MRKTVWFAMCGVMAALMVAGCATGGGAGAGAAKAMSDADAIAKTLDTWRTGMETKDLAKLGEAMSDKFNHYEWGNKQSMLDFLKTQFEQGTLEGAKVDATKAQTKIENGVATVYPVSLTAPFGTATIEFKLEKESDGIWRATGITVEGV